MPLPLALPLPAAAAAHVVAGVRRRRSGARHMRMPRVAPALRAQARCCPCVLLHCRGQEHAVCVSEGSPTPVLLAGAAWSTHKPVGHHGVVHHAAVARVAAQAALLQEPAGPRTGQPGASVRHPSWRPEPNTRSGAHHKGVCGARTAAVVALLGGWWRGAVCVWDCFRGFGQCEGALGAWEEM
jgi:hypothetical protein